MMRYKIKLYSYHVLAYVFLGLSVFALFMALPGIIIMGVLWDKGLNIHRNRYLRMLADAYKRSLEKDWRS